MSCARCSIFTSSNAGGNSTLSELEDSMNPLHKAEELVVVYHPKIRQTALHNNCKYSADQLYSCSSPPKPYFTLPYWFLPKRLKFTYLRRHGPKIRMCPPFFIDHLLKYLIRTPMK